MRNETRKLWVSVHFGLRVRRHDTAAWAESWPDLIQIFVDQENCSCTPKSCFGFWLGNFEFVGLSSPLIKNINPNAPAGTKTQSPNGIYFSAENTCTWCPWRGVWLDSSSKDASGCVQLCTIRFAAPTWRLTAMTVSWKWRTAGPGRWSANSITAFAGSPPKSPKTICTDPT